MINYKIDYAYVNSEDVQLFTVTLVPDNKGKFPTVVLRTPYVDVYENQNEEDIAVEYLNQYKGWLNRGYAIAIQHCRGKGKSSGEFVPYINERPDTLTMYEWVRKQDFYNGELFLNGGSYWATVHQAAAPFGDDVKGAIFGVQDTETYNIYYRNGIYKKRLHGLWYVRQYKTKSHLKKNYTLDSFNILPFKDFTKTVFGEADEVFDEMLKAPKPTDKFWSTRNGLGHIRNVTDNLNFPVLLTTGFYDIYTGGIFDMWNKMSEKTKKMSAFVVSPNDHGDNENPINFPNGTRMEQFGKDYEMDWFDYIRGVKSKSPFEVGKVSYYRLFENKWAADDFAPTGKTMDIRMGEKEVTYLYNPFDPPTFKGGLSRAYGAAQFQDPPNSRYDIVSVYTEPFEKDVFVKGKMTAKLKVKSDCEDTCFYVRVSIAKEQGDYGLRDDITTLCYELGDYTPNTEVELSFECDEHAFLIKKGEKLRIDIASASHEHYLRHTNNKGLFSEQTTAKVAHNTVILQDSYLTIPIE